jgi:hypothetical protein
LNVASIQAGTASLLSGWVEAGSFYGKSAVYAGASDQTVLGGYGLSTGFVDVDTVYAGSVYASYKSFRIDNPIDPENKILNHWSVESSELKNIYDGVATLDADGAAVVKMPAWFDGLNRDFRYQLTAIGAPAANLYVAEELTAGQFRIAGGKPRLRVSWQVTGVRHDSAALKHQVPVEEMKAPEDRGKYLDPAAFGKPASMALRQRQPLEPSAARKR